jgi:uncharacterized protein (DUF488 family)
LDAQRTRGVKVYTIGYDGRNPADLVALLQQKGIRAVVDVRLRPDRASMGSYVRAKSPDRGIQALLNGAGIEYFSFPELGNIFLDRDDWSELYSALLNRAGDLLTARLKQTSQPFCLMCAEKHVAECHRRLIAGYLVENGYQVEHLE